MRRCERIAGRALFGLNKYVLPVLIVATSILYIWLIPNQPASVKLLFKLIPMWLMIAYAWQRRPAEPRR